MGDEKKPDGWGIGDHVYSTKLNIGGVVTGISPCILCKSGLLEIGDGEGGTHGYFHAESFEVFDPNKPFTFEGFFERFGRRIPLGENRWEPCLGSSHSPQN